MEVCFEGVQVRRGRRVVLELPALTIASGSITAVLGPNGSGKSTLLRTIAALERPIAGRVLIGNRIVGPNRATRRLVAFAFQEPVFVTGSLGANFDLALRLRGVPQSERRTRIEAMAQACGIAHALDRDARALSGGEAQRASLARALALQAPVTLLDEPLAGLDAPSREQLLRDLPGLLSKAAGTVVLVTHDRDEAARLGSNVVILLDGRVHASGSLREIFARPPDPPSALFLGWTVARDGESLLAIAPGVLHPGRGDVELQFLVRQVIDFGPRWEAIGEIAGSPARLTGAGDAPRTGSFLLVSSSDAGVLRYPGETNHQGSGVPITNR